MNVKIIISEAAGFAERESRHLEPLLYGITDGKAVGTYLEQKFVKYLAEKYHFPLGNSASGIDFPNLDVDIKVTSIRQPQSSCPFKSARQKIYGLGYHLLIFVYEKKDNPELKASHLNILHVIFVHQEKTADYQTTKGIIDILNNNGNLDDIIAFIQEKHLPVDDIGGLSLAEEILKNPPTQGFLTISNALQWRLQYSRIIQHAGVTDGIIKIR